MERNILMPQSAHSSEARDTEHDNDSAIGVDWLEEHLIQDRPEAAVVVAQILLADCPSPPKLGSQLAAGMLKVPSELCLSPGRKQN